MGHLWVIRQASVLFDELTVAIGENPDKKYLFSVQQRKKHVEDALKELKIGENTSIAIIHNKFLVKYAEEMSIPYLVRGIRGPNDFNYEHVMNQVNRKMAPKVETIYLIPPAELSQVSSNMVKGLVGPEGWEEVVQKYIPKNVLSDLKKI